MRLDTTFHQWLGNMFVCVCECVFASEHVNNTKSRNLAIVSVSTSGMRIEMQTTTKTNRGWRILWVTYLSSNALLENKVCENFFPLFFIYLFFGATGFCSTQQLNTSFFVILSFHLEIRIRLKTNWGRIRDKWGWTNKNEKTKTEKNAKCNRWWY